jgi:outer membrane usher protein
MRGEVYLTGLTTSNQLRATWGQQSCEFALPFPETTDPLPHLGTYTCSGEEP